METSNGVKKYEVLEHRADLKIRAFGKNKEELFCNMLLGMSESVGAETKEPEEKTKRGIKIESPDLPALLVDFLNEAIYLSQINKEVYFKVKFEKFSDNEIKGELIGQKAERFGEDIKAATHHGLKISRNLKDRIWEMTVLFDI